MENPIKMDDLGGKNTLFLEIAIYIKNYIVTTLGLSRWFSGFTTEEAAAKIIVDLKLQRAFNPEGSHRIYETFNVPWWSCRSVRCCCAFTCRLAGNNQSTEGLELHYIVGWGGCLVGRLGSCMHTCLFCNPAKNLSGVHFGTRPSKLYNFWSFKGHTCKNRYFSDLHVAVNMCIFSYLLPPLVLSYLILSCFVSSILSHLTLSDLVFFWTYLSYLSIRAALMSILKSQLTEGGEKTSISRQGQHFPSYFSDDPILGVVSVFKTYNL